MALGSGSLKSLPPCFFLNWLGNKAMRKENKVMHVPKITQPAHNCVSIQFTKNEHFA